MARMYSINSTPCGRSWAEWAQLWWKWCYSRSLEQSPVSDISGRLCTVGQRYEKVWFLAGTFGGNACRKCKIPAGRSLFFPVINDLISFATEPHLETEDELRRYAKADLDEARFPPSYVKVDGFNLEGLMKYRVLTPMFQIRLPPKKRSSPQIGAWFEQQIPLRTQSISDGYWVFLKPLSEGEHRIEFVGEKLQYDKRVVHGIEHDIKVPLFRIHVIYHLKIG